MKRHFVLRPLRRLMRVLGYTLLALIVSANLFIVLSGRFYLYKGIANTYLVGKTGPGIYDEDIFYNKRIERPDSAFRWSRAKGYNEYELTSEETEFMQHFDTKAYLVFYRDSLLFEKYFDEHKPATISNSFSAAKTVVALLIAIAYEEGSIKSLDEPVGNYLPEYREHGREQITIRHLLWMSSGISWEESGKNPLSDNAESYYGYDLRGLIARQESVEKPGVRFNYQSGNSQILAFVLEKATGKDLAQYMQEKLWKPLGAESDALWNLDKKDGDEKAFCCLYATAHDFAKVGGLMLHYGKFNGRRILSDHLMHEMYRNPPLKTEEGLPNMRYGLHVWTYKDPSGQADYCRGILGQYIVAIPEKDLIVVRLGTKRDENYEIPLNKRNDRTFVRENEFRVGHPKDLETYLRIADACVKKYKQ